MRPLGEPRWPSMRALVGSLNLDTNWYLVREKKEKIRFIYKMVLIITFPKFFVLVEDPLSSHNVTAHTLGLARSQQDL